MLNIVVALQVITGIITGFFILVHDPKSEGLGSIGNAAGHFKGVRTSADEKLDNITWFFASLFMLFSALVGLGLVK